MTLPKFGATAVLDLAQWNAAINKMIDDAKRADDSLNDVIASLGEMSDQSVDISVDVSVDTPTEADIAAELGDLKLPDETVAVNLEEKDTNTQILEDINNKLGQVRAMAIIDFLWSIPGKVMDFFDTISKLPIVGGGLQLVITLDTSANQLAAQVGAGNLPRDLKPWLADMIATDDASAEMWINLTQAAIQMGYMGDHMKEIVPQAQKFVDTFNVADPGQAIEAATRLVETGLLPSTQDAFDLMTKLQQIGVNRDEGMLGALSDSSSMLKEMKFTGGELFTLLKSGWEQNRTSASETLGMLDRFNKALQDPSNRIDLQKMGLLDEKKALDAGKITGGQFFNAFIAAVQAQPVSQQFDFVAKFFGPSAARAGGLTKFLGLDATDEALSKYKGLLDQASGLMDNTLEGVMGRLTNTLNVAAEKILSSDSIDLPGKLNTLKQQVMTFADELSSGTSVGGAIEIAFHLPGFEAALNRFESTVGNIFLDLMGTLANLLDILRQGEAAKALRGTIAAAAKTQLSFDVQTSDTEGISEAVKRAVARGVDPQELGPILKSSFDELMNKGDIVGAGKLADQLAAVFSPELSKEAKIYLDQFGGDYAKAIAAAQAQTTSLMLTQQAQALHDNAADFGKIAAEISAAQTASAVGADTMKLQADNAYKAFNDQLTADVNSNQFDAARQLMKKAGFSSDDIEQYMTAFTTALGKDMGIIQKQAADGANDFDNLKTKATTSMDKIKGASKDLASDLQINTAQGMAAWAAFIDQIVAKTNEAMMKITALSGTAQAAMQGVNLNTGGGPMAATATPHAPGGPASGLGLFGEQGPELASLDERVNILNASSTRAIVSGLQALLSGAHMPTGGGTVQNNQYNFNFSHMQTGAQTWNALQWKISREARGF